EPILLLGKRPGVQGPIDDAFTAPFLCVRGTGKAWNPTVQAWSDASLKRFAYEWHRYFRSDLPIKADTAVIEDDVRRCNLILLGDPGSNPWIANVLPKLPLHWTREELQIGGERYAAADHVPLLIQPNPLAEGRYVVLNSGHTFHEKELASLNYLLFPRLGDWAVLMVGGEVPKDPSGPLTETVVQAGVCGEGRKRATAGDKALAAAFRPAAELATDFGKYKSPQEFADGHKVKTAAEWPKRREEILKTWHEFMGPWPALIEKPKIEYLEK